MKDLFNLLRNPDEILDFDAIKIGLSSPETVKSWSLSLVSSLNPLKRMTWLKKMSASVMDVGAASVSNHVAEFPAAIPPLGSPAPCHQLVWGPFVVAVMTNSRVP